MAAFRKSRFEPVVSTPLVDELIDVLSRPRIVKKYQLAPDEVAAYVALILEKSNTVSLAGTLRLCRDPRDDFVLETAITGGAACLVSRDDDIKGDQDLRKVMKEHGVSILTVARFLTRLQETKPSADDG